MNKIDCNSLTSVFSLWAGEIKDLGQFLPFQNEIFELVITEFTIMRAPVDDVSLVLQRFVTLLGTSSQRNLLYPKPIE